jgi:hypothetical protein
MSAFLSVNVLAQCDLDTEAPVIFGVPADSTEECSALPEPGDVSVSDNCDSSPTLTLDLSFDPGAPDEVVIITRTWTATDTAGNASSVSQTVTVVDTTPPTIDCPNYISVECIRGAGPANTSSATASDSCTDVDISSRDTLIPGSTCEVERVWTATDACGNEASCTQPITLTDTTAPTITCPASMTLECPASTSIAANGTATATDNCEYTITSEDDTLHDWRNMVRVVRTWTATDACGNSASCNQTIDVVDTTAPTITCPASMTLECPASTSIAANGSADASDTCGAVTIDSSDSNAPDCGGTFTLTRTWTAEDEGENTSTCDQVITVIDTTAPSITCPADATVECTTSTDLSATGTADASDTCSGVSVDSADTSVAGCGERAQTITRTWTATDDCGNDSSCEQTVTVVDTTAPSIDCPADQMVECSTSAVPSAIEPSPGDLATASDACGGVTITSNDVSVAGCGGNTETITITRTWTATDDCSNTTSCAQTISVEDTTAPSVECPANATVECGDSLDVGVVTASDTCGGVSISLGIAFAPACGSTGIITRTWTATDDCDNTNSCVQTITIVDTVAPEIQCNAADICSVDGDDDDDDDDDDDETFTATVTDVCDADVKVVITGLSCTPPPGDYDYDGPTCVAVLNGASITITDPGYAGTVIKWSVSATDDCGNNSTVDCSVTVLDCEDDDDDDDDD